MLANAPLPPTHLAIFVTDPDDGKPVQRLPLYAEIALPKVVPQRPSASARITEPLRAALTDLDPSATGAVRVRVESVVLAAAGQALTDEALASLFDFELANNFFKRLLKIVLSNADAGALAEIDPATRRAVSMRLVTIAAGSVGGEVPPEGCP